MRPPMTTTSSFSPLLSPPRLCAAAGILSLSHSTQRLCAAAGSILISLSLPTPLRRCAAAGVLLLLLLVPLAPAARTNLPSPNRITIMVNPTNYVVLAPTNAIIGKWSGDGSGLSNLTVTASVTNMSGWSSSPATQTVNMAYYAITNVSTIYAGTNDWLNIYGLETGSRLALGGADIYGYGNLLWPGNTYAWDLDLQTKFDVYVNPGFIHLKTGGTFIKLESGSDIYLDPAAGKRIYAKGITEVQDALYARSLRITDPSTNSFCTITTTNITFGTNTIVINFSDESITASSGTVTGFTYYGNGSGLTNLSTASMAGAARTNEDRTLDWTSATVSVDANTFQVGGTNVVHWHESDDFNGTNHAIWFVSTNGSRIGFVITP